MTPATSSSKTSVRAPIAILGVPFDNVSIPEALEAIDRMVASGQPHYLVTANVDFLVQAREDVELRRILFDAHLVLCDGTPLVWAARLLGNPLPERVAGSDLVPLLLQVAAEKGYRVFFLGATPESASRAVALVQAKYPTLCLVGHYSPPFNELLEMDHDETKRRILEAKPDLLFVSLGCPKQEKWMAMHYRGLGVPVVAGVGATIDFLAGQVKRAPRWMQRSGTEWIFRLAQEPRRLFRRYMKDLWVFGWGFMAQWWRLQFRARPPAGSALETLPAGKTSPASAGRSQAAFQRVRFSDRLDVAAVDAQRRLVDQILADRRDCLLDVRDLQFIDSTGVGLLIRLQKSLSVRRRQLVLVAPSPAVRRALALMRLETFFAAAPDFPSAKRLLQSRVREPIVTQQTKRGGLLAWRGEVTAGNVEVVWQFTQAQLNALKPARELVVDLSAVRFMDSTGLGLMVRAKKLAQSRQATLRFARPSPSVQNVVRLAGLEEFLLPKNTPVSVQPPSPAMDRSSRDGQTNPLDFKAVTRRAPAGSERPDPRRSVTETVSGAATESDLDPAREGRPGLCM